MRRADRTAERWEDHDSDDYVPWCAIRSHRQEDRRQGPYARMQHDTDAVEREAELKFVVI